MLNIFRTQEQGLVKILFHAHVPTLSESGVKLSKHKAALALSQSWLDVC